MKAPNSPPQTDAVNAAPYARPASPFLAVNPVEPVHDSFLMHYAHGELGKLEE